MYEDQPPFGADEKCRAAYFGPHPLGRSVLGTAESVAALGVEAMRDYVRRRYGADHVVLAAAGRLDFDALLADTPGGLRLVAGFRRPAGRPAAEPRPGFHSLHRPAATQQYALRGRRPRRRRPRPLRRQTAGHDPQGRLGQPAVLEGGRSGQTEHAELNHCEYEGAGVFFTSLSCPDETAENLRRVLALYRAARSGGITAAELRRPRARSAPGLCWPASGPAAASSPSAAIGSTAASTAASRRSWTWWRPSAWTR